jgi:hypothetical protein
LAGRIRPIEKSSDFIGIPTRDLPACSKVPQPTMVPTADILLKGWMADLMAESLSRMGRWLKMMMQVTAVVKKGAQSVHKICNIEFYTYGQ